VGGAPPIAAVAPPVAAGAAAGWATYLQVSADGHMSDKDWMAVGGIAGLTTVSAGATVIARSMSLIRRLDRLQRQRNRDNWRRDRSNLGTISNEDVANFESDAGYGELPPPPPEVNEFF
jgi:hypothetical protein